MTKQKEETKSVAVVDHNQELALSADTVSGLQDLRKEVGSLIHVRREMLKVARIKLTQKMSKATDGGLAKPGEFSCDVKGLNFGTTLEIIPIMVNESASFMDKETSQVICSTDNLVTSRNGNNCQHSCPYNEYWNDWGTSDAKKVPACKHALDFMVLIPGDSNPYEMNFRKSNSKAGKAILNLMAYDKYGVPFGSVYKMKSVPKTKDNYSYSAIDENSIEKRQLTNEEIRSIMPIVKECAARHKEGTLEREAGDDSDQLPI